MNLIRIVALQNNYIWILYNSNRECIVIDPSEAAPVLQVLKKYQFKLTNILLTHHHHDHVNGVPILLKNFFVPVYGPYETVGKGTNIIVTEGDSIILLEKKFNVFYFPGHTLGHIGFYSDPWLFCGDTVFSAGCGRIFEGTPKQMYDSFQKINKLPLHTIICCAHEYTLVNIAFANYLLPKDKAISSYQSHVKQLLAKNKNLSPTTLGLERIINIFFRCHDCYVQNVIKFYPLLGEEWRVFAILRKKRDQFPTKT
ncbi:hydroxyacylglutathione hydrolase [Candidatus Palibaumannia cicadellinicola]|uniref:Hydroxyacylglutathione hydrolase n=1 Tax=Candidatus Palibaumannia cicadellinicola TaxID=186490 RepID=A0A0K2BKU2_9GAMM|nr:hydroxyacylglutathione hydrolase [Candidatus Baumannia cicadellinicola]AKZ66011.1 Hydroxyacylglutathione hydrolase [Candidatus Baumannia cicadellinicola]